MSNFEIAGTQLRIGDVTIEFRHEIANVIEHSEGLIVRLDPPGGVTDKTNILGVDYHGNKMWEIEEPEGQHFRESFFKSMQKQGRHVLVRNWNSFEYRLNPVDGTIKRIGKWDR